MSRDQTVPGLRGLGYLADLAVAICVSVALYWLPPDSDRIAGVVLLLWWLLRDVSSASPGKRLCRLRVIAREGAEASTGQRVLRNITLIAAPILMLFRVTQTGALLFPAGTLFVEAAFLFMSGRRVGDMIAGTDVIKTK